MAMLTYTDRVVLPVIATNPSLIDIGVSLSRMPRFGGHTRRWWSVLDHTLFCDELVRNSGCTRHERLAVLLHDAHEAVTADVPTDAKGNELRWLQQDLDRVIMEAFFPGGWTTYQGYKSLVKRIDFLALVAEAHIVGPPVSARRLVEVEPRFSTDGLEGADGATSMLRALIPSPVLGIPPKETQQDRHPAVIEFLNRMTHLM